MSSTNATASCPTLNSYSSAAHSRQHENASTRQTLTRSVDMRDAHTHACLVVLAEGAKPHDNVVGDPLTYFGLC